MDDVKISKKTIAAMEELFLLQEKGKLFVKDSANIQRTCEVYLACCKLADEVSKDAAKDLDQEAEPHEEFQVFYKSKMHVRVKGKANTRRKRDGVTHRRRVRVSGNYCAVYEVDYERRACRYIGIQRC